MLTLLVLNEDMCKGECKPSSGEIISIVAGFFYLGVDINILFCPVPKDAVMCGNRIQSVDTRDCKSNEVPRLETKQLRN